MLNLPDYLDPSVDSTVEMPVDAALYERTPPIWPATVMSQYANSPRLMALIESFGDALNVDALSDLFFDSIWNIHTATGFGLDVWGRIVNVRRTLYIPGGQAGRVFGFGEQGAGKVFGFGQATFNTFNVLTPNYVLGDDDYRRLILVKALSNISDRSIPTMNAALMQLFAGQGRVYVSDLGNMRAEFVFSFTPTAIDLAILTQSGAFATPSGVLFDVRVFIPGATFGFAEQGSSVATFAHGAFNN
jgi:hypothetical protein